MEAFWVPEQEWGNSQFETFSFLWSCHHIRSLFGKYTKSGHFIYRRNKHLSCYSDHNEGSQCRWPDQNAERESFFWRHSYKSWSRSTDSDSSDGRAAFPKRTISSGIFSDWKYKRYSIGRSSKNRGNDLYHGR